MDVHLRVRALRRRRQQAVEQGIEAADLRADQLDQLAFVAVAPVGAAPDYKPGIAALYREIDVPVHPVATNAGVHWPKHGFMRKPGTIVFEYLEPIAPGLKRAEFMRLLQDRIETASTKLLTL